MLARTTPQPWAMGPCLAHMEQAVSVCMERTLHGQGAALPVAIPGPYTLLDTHDPKLPFAQDVDKVTARLALN